MKNFVVFLLIMINCPCFAQDRIYFHNGKVAEGKVVEVKDKSIKFVYQGENAVYVLGCNAISEILFGSGRKEQISEKIVIATPQDWQKVRVVYDKEEIQGLKLIGPVEKHSSGTWSFSVTGGHFSEKTLKKVRQEAAKQGGCYVLILSSKSNSGGVFKDGNASMTGEIYTY